MREAVRLFIEEARRDLSQDRSSQFFVALLAVMVMGLAILAILGNEVGPVGLLIFAGGLPGAVAVAVCAHASTRTRK